MASVLFREICAIAFIIGICSSQRHLATETNKDIQDLCLSKTTCGECVKAHASCIWCSEDGFTKDGSKRCVANYQTWRRMCDITKIVDLDSTVIITMNKEVGANESQSVHLSPQRAVYKLIPSDPLHLEITFRQSEDFPMDLYFLMDLSKSMDEDKFKLARLANTLGEKMSTITTNFRLGFGSFASQDAKDSNSPTTERLKESQADPTSVHGFRHHLTLSTNTSTFNQGVKNAGISESGTLNSQEGFGVILEAIIQTIACKNEIGWRERSTKLLMISSNRIFHGKNKTGSGVPNDGLCHLDSEGYYSSSTIQDYPTVSQVNQKIKENNVTVVFAVTRGQVDAYERLSEYLEGSVVLELRNDLSNVLDFIKHKYEAISFTVELRDTANENMKVTYSSECLDGELRKRNSCEGLKFGSTVTFDVLLEVLSCPNDRKLWKKPFSIYPVGLNESTEIVLEMTCECPCEEPEVQEIRSDRCSGVGSYTCGDCNCPNNTYGWKCECQGKDTTEYCQGSGPYMCSGRGECKCGACVCYARRDSDQRVYGPNCECDNFSCDRFMGQICNGQHGRCECGICVCERGWKGDACDINIAG